MTRQIGVLWPSVRSNRVLPHDHFNRVQAKPAVREEIPMPSPDLNDIDGRSPKLDLTGNDWEEVHIRTTPPVMRMIGHWMSSRERHLAPPQEFVGPWDEPSRQRVLEYLAHGHIRSYRGYSSCRFPTCPAHAGPLGSRDHTDGIWAWPEGLAHYVRDHDVQLPVEFVDHVLAQEDVPVEHPCSVEPGDAFWFDADGQPHRYEYETAYWSEWCAKHRSGAFRR